jgi:hypothetical protein
MSDTPEIVHQIESSLLQGALTGFLAGTTSVTEMGILAVADLHRQRRIQEVVAKMAAEQGLELPDK